MYLAQARQTVPTELHPALHPSVQLKLVPKARGNSLCGVSVYRKACAPALGRCQEEATTVSSGRKKGI